MSGRHCRIIESVPVLSKTVEIKDMTGKKHTLTVKVRPKAFVSVHGHTRNYYLTLLDNENSDHWVCSDKNPAEFLKDEVKFQLYLLNRTFKRSTERASVVSKAIAAGFGEE